MEASATPDGQPASTGAHERLPALDILRGVAVLGILLINIASFGLPFAYELPLVGGASGADLWTWRASTLLFEGTMRGLFSLLFGAGLVLFFTRLAARAGPAAATRIHLRRMFWLALFGVVDWALLLWEGDILFWYGITGALLFWARDLPSRALVGAAAIMLALGSAFPAMVHHEARLGYNRAAEAAQTPPAQRTPAMQAAIDGWERREAAHHPSPERVAASIAERRQSSYPALFAARTPKAAGDQIFGYLYFGFLDVASMMLLGIVALRWGLLTGRWRPASYLRLAAAGYALGLAVNLYEIALLERSGFGLLAYLQAGISYQLGRVPTTFGHLGLIMWMIRAGALAALQRRLAAVGRLAFSNYVLTTILCQLTFTGLGLGLFGQLARHELYLVVAAVWVVLLLWSPLWLRRFRFGPLEWLWRSLTYRRAQPLRRRAA